MNQETDRWWRLALITALVEYAPGQVLGRTAVVKLPYLLQTLRNVSAGYSFSLYSYGPFDSDVLNDLDYAAFLQAVEVQTVTYPSGYGYNIRPGPKSSYVKQQASVWLREHQADIEWAAREFGSYSATDLGLIATIIYVDRERAASATKIPLEELVRQVRAVKPQFTEAFVTAQVETAQAKGWLMSVLPRANAAPA
jgi:hypothetical protein